MYSSPVCPPDYVKKLTKGAAISSLYHYASQGKHDCKDAGGRTNQGDRVENYSTYSPTAESRMMAPSACAD